MRFVITKKRGAVADNIIGIEIIIAGFSDQKFM